ncbi:MAG: SDR family oxidoreductase [Pseudomonadales bacterium]|jgi:NAD(P)-dependent dehydrogenase (short-subunit alcohol dehydrogenase family)|nr:SDR family oxidoreductase [Pseudomonadales bacterium]MDP7359814.1 SDR family oxidoreductase [Pseudomonadales bacterium]HJN51389.1 SDR family oxidoreductase [Pseudomonadales bacterium]|tara:strand:+ start:10307 stop:11131 length:825 start_codon:yes stop_codon:yes gene_type:complete
MNLENKVVLITGAGLPNGIGAGIARCFANEKAKVVVTDLDASIVDETATSLPTDALGLVADAASQAAMDEAVDKTIDKFGGLDVLVNNAGVGGPTLSQVNYANDPEEEVALFGMSDAAWDAQLMFNLRTTFSSSSAAAAKMNDGGSIVNIASIAALGPATGLPAYGAAKAGVVHLTKTHAMQLAARRIRVNCICPGLLWTRAWEMLATNMKAQQTEFANMSIRQVFETVVARSTPLGGEQTPEDIGNLAVFYASDWARMITGQVVAVDGGISVK